MTHQIHTAAVEGVFRLLQTRPEGLDDRESAERLRALGPNRLQSIASFTPWRSLLKQFTNFFSLLLDAAAILCFVANYVEPDAGMTVLGSALLAVAVLNGVFSFLQEARAERAMQELRKFLPERVLVRRAGSETELLAEDLVVGDVLIVNEGDRVPADARIVESHALLVDNAPLTGESHPVSATAEPACGRLVDSPNVLFAGSSVLRGNGTAVVFATGRRTEFGRVAELSVEVRRPQTPLELETARMVRTLTIVAVGMGVSFFVYGVVAGRALWTNLVFMLGIIVANVPEGLLPTFTLALAVGAMRLARKKVLVKSLNAVEALGSIQVICTDKTGTLTLNRLAVSRMVDPTSGVDLPSPEDEVLAETALTASALKWKNGAVTGDPLDVAIARRYSSSADRVVRVTAQTRSYFPFDVETRRAAGVRDLGNAGGLFVVKGAWEALRSRVGDIRGLMASAERLEQADRIVQALASAGQRVIAVASRSIPSATPEEPEEVLCAGLSLTGFIALEDPLRPEVPEAMRRCHTAGIDVALITGDHPETARAIAGRAGLLRPDAQKVLTGDALESCTRAELRAAWESGTRVFARTTPEQKMAIVSALKSMGLVVGMTGDGVNDAPALKAADVGIAMGERGTDVARETAALVLLDDNFASIVKGIEEGRAIFDNMRKFTSYVLVSNGPEILPYLLYILFPIPLALGILHILLIDLGTDIVPSMALGQEPPEPEAMNRPPRRRDERLLDGSLLAHSYGFLGLIEAAYALFLFFLVLVQGGWTWGQPLETSSPLHRSAVGICLATIMLMQVGNFVGRRSATRSGLDRGLITNRLTLLGFGLEIVCSYCVLYVPPVADVLQTGPVEPWVYGLAALGAPLIFCADYARKRFKCRSRVVRAQLDTRCSEKAAGRV
ncbi:MAG TPA: cation-transporting P-type ATPase [Polyangiaceae bacterium]|nr:cation-transporting P-type ATPase [Polyangiaceae bacterium]